MNFVVIHSASGSIEAVSVVLLSSLDGISVLYQLLLFEDVTTSVDSVVSLLMLTWTTSVSELLGWFRFTKNKSSTSCSASESNTSLHCPLVSVKVHADKTP